MFCWNNKTYRFLEYNKNVLLVTSSGSGKLKVKVSLKTIYRTALDKSDFLKAYKLIMYGRNGGKDSGNIRYKRFHHKKQYRIQPSHDEDIIVYVDFLDTPVYCYTGLRYSGIGNVVKMVCSICIIIIKI
jgi:hypothetical protein